MSLKLLRNKNLFLVLMGQFVSLIGTDVQNFALSLYILKITGSGKIFASVLAIALIPRLVIGPICGVFADRFDRKKIIVGLDMICGLLIGGLYIISITIGVQLIHIYMTVISLSLISSMFNPTIGSVIPSIIEKENLLEANSMNAFLMTTGSLIAPMLGGVLYGIFGLPCVLLINSISFIFSSVSEMFITLPKREKSDEKFSYRLFKIDFADGIKFIKNTSILKKILICAFIINFTFNPAFSIGFIYISKMVMKITDMQFGLLETCLVAGALIGPIFVSRISKKFTLSKIVYLTLTLSAVFVGIIAVCAMPFYLNLFSGNLVPFITLTACGVIMMTIVTISNIALSTIRQKEIPNEFLGRVNSVWITVSMGVVPLGQMAFGVLFDKLPSYIPMLITAASLVITGFVFNLSVKEPAIISENVEKGTTVGE